jgi:DNA helicase II / ATP-dependent DNA helicase PcrA
MSGQSGQGCPLGWRDALPCSVCDCGLRESQPTPPPRCDTRGSIPCVGCGPPCAYAERRASINCAVRTGYWPDGQVGDDPWGAEILPTRAEHEALERLNDDQLAAATHYQGPLVVTAGAGSGKTTALTARIVWMVEAQGVEPGEILGITFTRRAAKEMRERLSEALGEDRAKGVVLSTFHALALRIARGNPRALDRKRGFSVWDDRVMSQQIRRLTRDAREARATPPPRGSKDYSERDLLGALTEQKQRSLHLDAQFRQSVEVQFRPHGVEAWGVLAAYEALKATANALDYSDLIWGVVQAARRDPDFAASLGHRWTYLQIDEFQDTNRVQIDLINLLAPHRNLVVVGDDDQAIYGWRGAEVTYILNFERDNPGARTVHLGQNYRCTPEIVALAAGSIAHNAERRAKRLWSERTSGAQVRVHRVLNLDSEARWIASECAAAHPATPWTEMAVLVRTRRQLRHLSGAFAAAQVPARVIGLVEWWQREDARLICAWLRAQINRRDLEAGAYLLGRWPRMGPVRIKRWRQLAEETSDDMLIEPLSLLALGRGLGAHTKAGRSLLELRALDARAQSLVRDGATLTTLVETLYAACGLDAEIHRDYESGRTAADTEAAKVRADHRQVFLDVAAAIATTGDGGIEEILDQIVLAQRAQEQTQDAVTISTIHGAKGLEWDRVWVGGCVQGLLPLATPADAQPTEERLAEERRLFYVAATRARDHLVLGVPALLSSSDREVWVKPSCFLTEGSHGVD